MQCWRSLETRCLQSNGSKASKTSETKANVSRFGPTELPIKRYWELKDSSRRMKALTGVCSTMATARSSMNLASTSQVGPISSAHFKGFCLSSFPFAVEGGMDFRAMLMKRKKPAKKVVVVRRLNFVCFHHPMYLPGVTTSFGQEFSIKRRKIVKVCLHSS